MPAEIVPIVFSHTGAESLWYIIIFEEATYMDFMTSVLSSTLIGNVHILWTHAIDH